MSTTQRQNNLLVAENWTTLYTTFREADFQSYDFETLRKSMIDYLRLYYPENFNDFIESSEYIALIDLIAFLGQSLAFRTDLNARENFIDTAERRDSILKLARMLSYNPKRCLPSVGLIKIDSVQTTENLTDSNGLNIANFIINWNDPSNDNWLEQFSMVLNAAMVNSQVVGKPSTSQVINNVLTQEYNLALSPGPIPVYKFTATVENTQMGFEAISGTTAGKTYIYEKEPKPGQSFNVLYQNDNFGNNSVNTGFFLLLKEGSLQSLDFTLNESLSNRVVSINFNNINNIDLWLYDLDTNGNPNNLWTQVPAISGLNIVYNQSSQRNLYQVNTRMNDQIDLVFGDGSFANIPQGKYRLYYRTSNGLSYKVTPDEIQGITIPVTYTSKTGVSQTLTFRASLYYTIANASAKETLDNIKSKAPQQYYTQNRMITGEDYNIVPYTNFSTIIKVKAVNRTSSGISKYLDVIDPTGKYSATNIFAQDGWLYREEKLSTSNFTFTTTADIYKVVYNMITSVIDSKEMLHYYYSKYPRIALNNTMDSGIPAGGPVPPRPQQITPIYWNLTSRGSNSSTGYFYDDLNKVLQIGPTIADNRKYLVVTALVKFVPPTGSYFNVRNEIVVGTPMTDGDKNYIYASIQQVIGDGSASGAGNLNSTTGAVTLNTIVPTGATAIEVIPIFKNTLPATLMQEIINLIKITKNFGLTYNQHTQQWQLILQENLAGITVDNPAFDLATQGDVHGRTSDASWLIGFFWVNSQYVVYYRGMEYTFESQSETQFYFDEKVRVYDSNTGLTLSDQVKILKTNTQSDSAAPIGIDYTWYVYKNIIEPDGYQNVNKIYVTFPDTNLDGVPDDPDLFEVVVDPDLNPLNKLVFFQLDTTNTTNYISYVPVNNNLFVTSYPTLADIKSHLNLYVDGQLFYATTDKVFYMLTTVNNVRQLVVQTNYVVKTGRQFLYFQYRHNSPNYRRIDPSPNNLMDLYILTSQYETDYRNWLQDTSGTVAEPPVPTSDQLKLSFSGLENLKAISDTIIYNSASYKPLFGAKADPSLQATFKVVKNPNVNISDNDIKTSVIQAINTYFNINNWDFGETFYFSELSAYLHSTLTPNIASVIIVPNNSSVLFGNLYQINCQPNEIVVSAATVDNVEIISAITAAQLNQTISGSGSS